MACSTPQKPKEEKRVVQETNNLEEVEKMSIAKVGAKAPDFTTSAYLNGEFREFKLSNYLGKWVMLCFYPADFTFVWPTELAAVAAKADEFKKLGVEVFPISCDKQFVHKIWDEVELSKMVEGDHYPYPLLSDPTGEIGKMYGVYDEGEGLNIRGRFFIDPDGVIQAIEILAPPVGRNVNEAIRQLQAFQYVRNAQGAEACPAGWEPGKKTLKPGPDLVGKVWEVWKVGE